MHKYEWRKHSKELYLPKQKPNLIDVPKINYFTIEGKGNPNNEPFRKNIELLYGMSYAIKMMTKKGIVPEGYYDYTVFPLEGYWDLDEEGRKLNYLDKNHLVYKLMIRQPDFVTREWFRYALNTIKQKKKELNLEIVKFETVIEGLSVQCMHVGSYDDEPATFKKMEQYCLENGLERIEKQHKEIYISDARKTASEKLKTVLRFKVKKI